MELKESFFDTGEVRLHVLEGPRSGPPLVLLGLVLRGGTIVFKNQQASG